MSVSVGNVVRSIFDDIAARRIAVIYAATWTLLLTATVAVASLAPEIAFVTAISTSSSFSKACSDKGCVRVLLNDPTEVFCFPAHMVRRSDFDFFVPTLFAALVVGASAILVRSLT